MVVQINNRQNDLSIIKHEVQTGVITQRASDGYVNATELCKACNKRFRDYSRNANTQEFISALSRQTGIPVTELIQTLRSGTSDQQASWVHPHVAINLGQWASPDFAVAVSIWVTEWITGAKKQSYQIPFHIRRYLINRAKIPPTHFSMLDQMTYKLLASLEARGYIIPKKLMPDISLGRMFSKELRAIGQNPDSFPTYEHVFDDGVRPPVMARLYPNQLMTFFNELLENWITSGKALTYFAERDRDAIEPIKGVFLEIEERQKSLQISNKTN